MDSVLEKIDTAQGKFKDLLHNEYLTQQSLPLETYKRFLSLQFHLTKDVQRHFYIAASHPDLTHRKKLRRFLFNFANEEEMHYKIAENDLHQLHDTPTAIPLDVKLWKAYFDKIVYHRPFVRLGATTILENISGKSQEIISKFIKGSDYLNPKNTKFLTIHLHEEVPHGDQIVQVLSEANLERSHIDDLQTGAEEGTVFYLRFMAWVFTSEN